MPESRNPPQCRSSSTSAAFPFLPGLAGAGIMLGIIGFLFAGLVDDSTVSVMPIFYTVLGLGIVINILQKAAE